MPLPVLGIAPVGPTVSLLTTARRLPSDLDWSRGLSYRQTNCPGSGRWRFCSDAEESKTASGTGGLTDFLPFTIYVPWLCDQLLPAREDEVAAEARAQLEAVTAWHVARELWTGEFNTTGQENPSLQAPFPGETDEFDPSHILLGPLDPVEATSALYAAYEGETRHGGGAVLHVPSRAMPSLKAEAQLTQQGSVFIGPNFVVSPGPGYPSGSGRFGPKTLANSDGASATAGQVWFYLTGPIEYALGPYFRNLEGDEPRWDRRMNRYQYWAERMAIVRFDPCSVWSTLVTLPTTE